MVTAPTQREAVGTGAILRLKALRGPRLAPPEQRHTPKVVAEVFVVAEEADSTVVEGDTAAEDTDSLSKG